MDNLIKTGYPALDKILGGGLHPGEVTVVAGRYNSDIVLLNIILNNLFRNQVAMNNSATIILYSIYDAEDNANRLICIEAGYEMHSGTPSIAVQKKIQETIEHLKETNLYIENIVSVPIEKIVESTQSFAKNFGLDFIIIDSFNTFVKRKPPYHPFGDPDDAMRAANKIKQMAKDLDVPVLVAYYPLHAPESLNIADVCKPMLDMADNIISLYHNEETNILKAEVTKNGNGITGTVNLSFSNWWYKIR